jgi:predicted regulator of Ras-like GTPase activity (Roadblock/LC7/MglB family)
MSANPLAIMFSILKKFFTKADSKPAAVTASVQRPQPQEPSAPVPTVEVAHLSLAAIVSRFPEDLKATVLRAPDAAATISFPLPLILKQLPSGSVKMSFASLHRQAPQGVFGPLTPGDKRAVEIPLAEIFRHVSPNVLRRRHDQRPLDLPEDGFNLFGNAENPYEIAPTTPDDAPPRKNSAAIEPTVGGMRVLKMDGDPRLDLGAAPAPSPSPAPAPLSSVQRSVVPPPDFHAPVAAASPHMPAPSSEPPLVLPLSKLSGAWPGEIRSEIAEMDPDTTVALPAEAVTAGLARGKVSFTWGEILSRLNPPPTVASAMDASTPLALPLKVVAPAFLAATKSHKAERKSVSLDESIPALFSDGRAPQPEPEVPALRMEEIPAPSPEMEMEAQPASVQPAGACADGPEKPATVGEIFGKPTKQDWTPNELVQGLVLLPGVAGAIVALQEGLPVAHSLPEGVKNEVVAAFLPQIFARLNQYAGEMKLGDVDDLLFTTHGAHCQIYRLGFLYLAVLGKPGESLPWQELQIISAEIARQTNK